MSYSTLQAVREAAGAQLKSGNETPYGVIDGTNKVFTAKNRPFVGRNYSDPASVSGGDVAAFVNNVAVPFSIDAEKGTVTLSTAPTSGQRVTISYEFSYKSSDYFAGKMAEAEDWIDNKIKYYVKLPLNKVPGTITTITNLYAAGLILSSEQGNSGESDSTSRDGALKLKTARELLADYIQGLKDETSGNNYDGSSQQASSATDGEVFRREKDIANRDYDGPPDGFFMRRGW